MVINSQGQMMGLLTPAFSGARLRIGFDSFPWRLGHNRIVRPVRHDTEHQGSSTWWTTSFHCSNPSARQGGSQLLSLAQRRETTEARTLLALASTRPGHSSPWESTPHTGKRWPIDCFRQGRPVAHRGAQCPDPGLLRTGEEEYNRG